MSDPIDSKNLVLLNKTQIEFIEGHKDLDSDVVLKNQFIEFDNYQKIYNSSPSFRELTEKVNYQRDFIDTNSESVLSVLSSMYTQVSQTRLNVQSQVEELRTFYLTNVIASQLVQDSLTPDVTTGNVMTMSSTDPKIQKELDYLDSKFNLDEFMKDVAMELAYYGEYTLSTVIRNKGDDKQQGESVYIEGKKVKDKDLQESYISENKYSTFDDYRDAATKKRDLQIEDSDFGLIGLNDTVNQKEVIPVTKHGRIAKYVKSSINDQSYVDLEIVHKSSYVYFAFDLSRIRIDIYREFNNLLEKERKKIEQLPRFIKIGKSIFYDFYDKFKELELLEKLVPATKLSNLSAGTVIGVTIGENMSTMEALKQCRSIEAVLNKTDVLNKEDGTYSMESILQSTGKIKVVPIQGEKGQLQKMDYKPEAYDNAAADANELRSLILSSIGIPPEIIYSSDSAESRGEMLKRYARYLRYIKAMQRSLIVGLRQMIYIHLAAKNIEFKAEDIEVSFANKLVEVDSLDKLEMQTGTLEAMSNFSEYVNSLGEEGSAYRDWIDYKAAAKYMNTNLRIAGIDGLFVFDKKTEKEDHVTAKDLGRYPNEEPQLEEPEAPEEEPTPEPPKEEPEKEEPKPKDDEEESDKDKKEDDE